MTDGTPEEVLTRIFRVFDVNSDGVITKKELKKVRELMKDWYDIKDRGIMGSGKDEIKEVTILGRRLRWMEDCLEYEADPGHRRKVMEMEGLEENSKSVVGPSVKGNTGEEEWGEDDLDDSFADEKVAPAAKQVPKKGR